MNLNNYLLGYVLAITALLGFVTIEWQRTDVMRLAYARAFEVSRASSESLIRTLGRGVNEAYRCVKK